MSIEQELVKNSGVERKHKESREAHLKRIVRYVMAKETPDSVYDSMSEEAQEWLVACVDVFNDKDKKKKTLPPLPGEDHPPEDGDQQPPEAQEQSEERQEQGGEQEEQAPPAPQQKSKPKKSAEKGTGRRGLATMRLKEIVLQNPKVDKKTLQQQLAREGFEMTDSTISVYWTDMRNTIKVLIKLGIISADDGGG